MSNVPHLPLSRRRRQVVTAGLMTGMFLAALEATIVATAMPTVIASLGGMSHYSWVFSAYLVASTVTVPVWGKLSDLYGRRLFYIIGIAVFLVGSVASGLSTNMLQLILFRTLQGIGAGALIPLGMTIIGEIYTLQERARMQGLFSGVWGLASIVGPLAGGFITDQLSWRWVFFVNVPFGLAAGLIMGLALEEEPRHGKRSIDYAGAVVLTSAVTMLLLALVSGGESGAPLFQPMKLALLAGAVILGFIFLQIEQRAMEPIIPLQLFSERTVSVAIGVGLLAGVAMFGAITYVPLFAQGARGDSATEAGSLLTPLMLSWVTMSIVGSRLVLRTGWRSMVLSGLGLMTVAFAVLWGIHPDSPSWWMVVDLALMGAGLGLTMLTLLLAVQQAVPRTQLGIATSMNQFARSIGGAIGVAVMGSVLSIGMHRQLLGAATASAGALPRELAQRLADNPSALIDPAAQQGLSPHVLALLRVSLATSLRTVFLAGAIVCAIAFIATLLWLPAQLGRTGGEGIGDRD